MNNNFFKALSELDGINIAVGVFGKEAAEIAFFNEFGTRNIPARSFIRSTLAEHKRDIVGNFAMNFQQTHDAKIAAALTSTYVENLIKAKIASGDFTPNAPSTIKKKGRNQPLVDTGRMLNSVKGIVRSEK